MSIPIKKTQLTEHQEQNRTCSNYANDGRRRSQSYYLHCQKAIALAQKLIIEGKILKLFINKQQKYFFLGKIFGCLTKKI